MAALAFGFSDGARAQENAPLPAYRNRLLGVFNEAGDPIEGAEVIDMLSRTSALTTKTGTISLVFLPDSGTMVRVQKIGYRPATLIVAISPNDTLPVTVVLSAIATTLPTVVTKGDSTPRHISPGLQAFEERRRAGFGRFVTEAELRKNDSKNMTSIIRTVAGIGVICPPIGLRRGECWAISRRQGSKFALKPGACEVDLYINGIPSIDNDLEKLKVTEFAGVEYYGTATIPSQYNKTGSSCGVLLLWMRER